MLPPSNSLLVLALVSVMLVRILIGEIRQHLMPEFQNLDKKWIRQNKPPKMYKYLWLFSLRRLVDLKG